MVKFEALQDKPEVDSEDEALAEMLGMSMKTFKEVAVECEEIVDDSSFNSHGIPSFPRSTLSSILHESHARNLYKSNSVYIFPKKLSIPADLMRRIALEITLEKYHSDKTYETIQVLTNVGGIDDDDDATIEKRRTLTRMENFVASHPIWSELCHSYLQQIVSIVMGEEMVLFKEKLNIKPPGGSGFAPHLDTPSLRIALGEDGPQSFITVMVAIDNMTKQNGCLRIAQGQCWSEENQVQVVEPESNGNPDGNGRAGAIALEVAEMLDYTDLECEAGTIALFNGWAPHRSAVNRSHFPRRAVFLTYNPKREGDFRNLYYQRMYEVRHAWKERPRLDRTNDYEADLDALNSIPRI